MLNNLPTREFVFTAKHFNVLRKLAQEFAGFYVSDDKMEMYYARLAKQLRKHHLNSFDEYINLLKHQPSLFTDFIHSITTNVTAFARESHHFPMLKEVCLQAQQPVFRVWSAGCSSGQEAYNIAVELWDICQRKGMALQVLASDIDMNVLAHAEKGIYAADDVAQINKDLVKRFFYKGTAHHNNKCKIKPFIRQAVTFERINLAKPLHIEHAVDAIFCRNVMIYFDLKTRQELLAKFHRVLNHRGHLFVGHSESLKHVSERFVNLGNTVYRRC